MELYCIDNKLNTHTLDLTIGKVYKIEHIHANVAYTTNDSGKKANFRSIRFADNFIG